jgi:hypothetical protein
MRNHMDLNGWRIDRVKPDWFHLWIKGEKFPHAGGPLDHIAKTLNQVIA